MKQKLYNFILGHSTGKRAIFVQIISTSTLIYQRERPIGKIGDGIAGLISYACVNLVVKRFYKVFGQFCRAVYHTADGTYRCAVAVGIKTYLH